MRKVVWFRYDLGMEIDRTSALFNRAISDEEVVLLANGADPASIPGFVCYGNVTHPDAIQEKLDAALAPNNDDVRPQGPDSG